MSFTALDTFIRALAAHDAQTPSGFVGKGKLVKLVAAEIPEEGFPGVWGSKSDILQRLDELLASGLASELNERATNGRCTLDMLARSRIQYTKPDGTVSWFEFSLGPSPANNVWPAPEAAPPNRPKPPRRDPASNRQSEPSTSSRPTTSNTPSPPPRERPASFLGHSPSTNVWPASEPAPPKRPKTWADLVSKRQSESSTSSRPTTSSTPSPPPRERPASFESFLGHSPSTNVWPAPETAPSNSPKASWRDLASSRQSKSSTSSRSAMSSTPSPPPREPPAKQQGAATAAATPHSAMNVPYSIQHAILPRLQAALEQSCFNFLRRYAPHILEAKGWVIHEAAELTHYTREIVTGCNSGEILFLAADPAVLKKLDEIRHKAVHREPITTEKLVQLLDSARAGAAALRDGRVGQLVDALRRLVDANLAPMYEKRDRAASLGERKRKIKSRLEDLEEEKRLLEREASRLDVEFRETVDSINILVANVGELYDDWGSFPRLSSRGWKGGGSPKHW